MDTCGLWVGCGWGGGTVGGVGNAPPVYGATARRLAWCPCRPGARGMRAGAAAGCCSWVLAPREAAGILCLQQAQWAFAEQATQQVLGRKGMPGRGGRFQVLLDAAAHTACLPACLALRAAPTTKIMCACTSQPYLVSVRVRSLLMFQGPAGKMEEPRRLGDQGAGSQPTWAWAGGRERGGGRNSVCSTTPVM